MYVCNHRATNSLHARVEWEKKIIRSQWKLSKECSRSWVIGPATERVLMRWLLADCCQVINFQRYAHDQRTLSFCMHCPTTSNSCSTDVRIYIFIVFLFLNDVCLQCFDAVGWVAGRASGLWKLSGGVVVWLSVWSEVQTCIWPSWCHCHSLSVASVKSRLVLLTGTG